MQQKQTHSRKLNNTLGIHDIHTAYTYNYNNDQPNTIESIYDEESGLSKYYKWDGKGNMTDRYDEQNKTNTKMCWTEDNRMQAYVQMNEGTDKGRAAYYGYNTSGERYVRYVGTTINITQNGITFHRPVLQSPVLYANSLITLNGKGYTKHYFEGDRRVCSKLGGGFTGRTEDDINDIILTDCITPIGDYSFIHHFNIPERSVAETNDIPMIKMGVRCKEHFAAIKFIVHFFSIYVHHCTLIIWLPTAHQTEMAEEYHKGDCHKWA